MAEYALRVNGAERSVDSDGARTLLEVLREDLALTGTKYGCGEGSCRSCTVLVDGRPVASCQTSVADTAGKDVVTIEGLAKEGGLHPVQAAFVEESGVQCGLRHGLAAAWCLPQMTVPQ